jgi:hypothetical protein
MWKIICAACAFVATLSPAAAQFYSDTTLDAKNPKALENLQYTVSDQLLATATPSVRDKLSDVRIATPRRSPKDPQYPMNFYSDPSKRQIIVPLQGFKFFSDLTIVWAWFDQRTNCGDDKATLAAYLATVMAARPEARGLGGPLEAFGLQEANVIRDPVVNTVSLNNFNTGMNFLLAHELGHIFYGDGLPGGLANSITREERADRFALDLLASAHIAPIGLVQFFGATRFNDPTLSAASSGTHPLSYARLTAIADRLKRNPESFLPMPFPTNRDFATERARLIRVADTIGKIGVALRDENFTYDAGGLLAKYPASSFRTVCR